MDIYRDSDFSWYLTNSTTPEFAEIIVNYGLPSDDAVVGDWDGDCADTIGIYRPNEGNWYLKNTNETGVADLAFAYGLPNERGVTGVWTLGGGGSMAQMQAVQDVPLMVVETDDAHVIPSGGWTFHADTAASGGLYLKSSGAFGDSLELSFSGERLEVAYLRGPDYGRFAIEVDGVIVAEIDAAQAEFDYAGRTVLGLPLGAHRVRVIALKDTVAMDAFIIPAQ